MKLTSGEVEGIPVNLVRTFSDMENRIMSRIVETLKNNGSDITSAVDWKLHRLNELGKTDKDIKKYIQDALKLSDDEIDRVFTQAMNETYTRDKTLYESAEQPFIPYEDNQELQQLVNAVNLQTKEECRNITQSLGFAKKQSNGKLTYTPVGDFYRNTLDTGLMEIATGITDYNTVLNRVVSDMTNSGLRFVDYESGWSNRVDVACRRALLTGYNQVVAKVNEDNAEGLGTEYFEVSYHSGARPTHQEWQGRVYTKEQLESVCGLGDVTGLCGANCYHSYSPFIMGISVRTYTDEEIDRMNAEDNTPREYNGKQYTKYEALQRQRTLETRMRAERQKVNRLIEGGADEQDIINARIKYRGTSDEYVKFSRAMNLPQQRQRVTVDGLRNIGDIKEQKSDNIANTKPVEKSAESGIILDKDLLNRDYKELTLEEFKAKKGQVTKEERKIIYGKTHFSGYINSSNARKINKSLREGIELTDKQEVISETLSQVIKNNVIDNDIHVYRHITPDSLFDIVGVEVPKPSLLEPAEVFWDKLSTLPEKIGKNVEFTEKGFLSTSAIRGKNVFTDRNLVFEIDVPKGTNGYITTNKKETEIIFDKGSKLLIKQATIENIKTSDFKIVLHCIIMR